MARLVLFGAVLGSAEAFQAVAGLRGTASLSKIAMQVAAEPVTQQAALAKAADEARGLAIDSISKAKSGHMGLPLGCAEIGAILYGQEMVYNPADPAWINRDRFILSAGHGSMFLYSWLHMAGFDLSMEEVANFRAKDSKTPGHPEFGWTPGVESTTGPLGQGVGNGVGLAAAGKLAAATLNTPEHTIIDHHVVVLCGDGCLQEGIANEAAAFAGHEQLDNLIVMYDSNGVTLDKMAEHTQSEDVKMRFEAQGWEVLEIDGHDMDAITKAYKYAKESDNGKPTLIVCKTIIGKGIDEIAGTCAAHGEAGVKYQDSGRESLGLPADKLWYVSPETYEYFDGHKKELAAKYDAWQETFAAWETANPELAKKYADAQAGVVPDLDSMMAEFEVGSGVATRNAGAEVLQPIAESMPFYVSGSADLHGSNKNYMKGVGDFSKNNYAGRNFYYGIREHAMGAIMNGMAYYGLFRVSGSTFLVFSDYMRASVRVAALSHVPTNYIWTHDSIGVGEDGPTHQPVETVSSLRLIPNLDVMRPGDAEETAAAYVHSIERKTGPTALILSRQNLPVLANMPAADKRAGTKMGAYTIVKETAELEAIIIGAGSELSMAVDAAAELGAGVRVVSMPCMELFERQSAEYIESVLPAAMKSKTVACEAGVTLPWYKFADKVQGVDSFGLSAPGDEVYEEKGMTVAKLVELVKA
uniref:Transketolase n=1 Tax=Calcidiscus leptoporus TaxID=127549 RepID=A0A7S0J6H3_9EUKA|mmetsp:Transcript_41834/g.97988  ORF Transcript_41834/g.97988 Transcript_41834/m.97988 type:complete len:698 (+) Transcript_41834:51-2144(+)